MDQCRNCGKTVQDQYCSHCGQKIHVGRISFHYITHEALHFFTHLEKGFLFTSLQMLISPATNIISFIEGKRKPYQPPISYFLIWTTIFILFVLFLNTMFGDNKVIAYNDYYGPGATTSYAITHLSFMLMFIIPFQSFYLYVLVTHGRYNYFESMVAGFYAIGTIIQLQFVFAVLSLLYFLTTSLPANLWYSDAFKIAYFIWFTISMLREFDHPYKLLRGLALILMIAGTFTLWRVYGVPVIAELLMK